MNKMLNESRNESRVRRSSSNGPALSIVGSSSCSPSSSSSLEGGFSRPPPSQHIVIQGWKSTQSKEPHHENPEKDEKRLLRVYSKRDKAFTEINATFVNDIDESWISKDLVERLELNRTSSLEDKPKYGRLGKKMFQFCGTVGLQWVEKGKSKYTKCRIVPDKSFEVYLHCSQLHPASPREKPLIIPDPLPASLPPLNEVSPSTTSPSAAMAGSFDGNGLAEVLDDSSKESIWADKWMSDLKASVHTYIKKPLGYLRDEDNPPVKIAVLDTGVDSKVPFIKGAMKINRIKGLRSFVKGDESTEDGFGHGTHVTALLLNVAPDAQIYVAKVAQDENIPSDHNIAEAIKWAVGLGVDIITMSFGLERDHAGMQKEILEAYSKNIIIFAAASNNGGNYDVTYPARKNEVICIYSTNGNGNASHCNPTPLKNSAYHFATLGVGVKSAWPKHLHENSEIERRMTGTSFSTPIAAGIAACILEFARMHKIEDDLFKVLRSREGMQEVFAKHLVDTRDELHYIHPWKLFADYLSDEEILLKIKDPLKRWVGNAENETSMR